MILVTIGIVIIILEVFLLYFLGIKMHHQLVVLNKNFKEYHEESLDQQNEEALLQVKMLDEVKKSLSQRKNVA